MDQLLSDQALALVVQTVGGLPNGIYSQSLSEQENAFGKSINFKKVSDPNYVTNYINQFLAIVTANDPSSSGGNASWQASLLNGGSTNSSGNFTVDFSGFNSAVSKSLSFLA